MVVNFLTVEEVATRLHKSRRWLQSFLKDHPYYRLAGRTKLFTEADLSRLYEALPRPSDQSRRVRASHRIGTAGGHTTASLLIEAQRLIGKPLRAASSANGNARLNVVVGRKRREQ